MRAVRMLVARRSRAQSGIGAARAVAATDCMQHRICAKCGCSLPSLADATSVSRLSVVAARCEFEAATYARAVAQAVGLTFRCHLARVRLSPRLSSGAAASLPASCCPVSGSGHGDPLNRRVTPAVTPRLSPLSPFFGCLVSPPVTPTWPVTPRVTVIRSPGTRFESGPFRVPPRPDRHFATRLRRLRGAVFDEKTGLPEARSQPISRPCFGQVPPSSHPPCFRPTSGSGWWSRRSPSGHASLCQLPS